MCSNLLQQPARATFESFARKATLQDFASLERELTLVLQRRGLNWSYRRVVRDLLKHLETNPQSIRLASLKGDAAIRAFLEKLDHPFSAPAGKARLATVLLTFAGSAYLGFSIPEGFVNLHPLLSVAVPVCAFFSGCLAINEYERLIENRFLTANNENQPKMRTYKNPAIYIWQPIGVRHRAFGNGFNRQTAALLRANHNNQPRLYVVLLTDSSPLPN